MNKQKQQFHGILKSWNEARGYGFIHRIGSEQMERFFLPICGIVSSPAEPKPGMHVFFDLSLSKPRVSNGFPVAGNAEIFIPAAILEGGAMALAKPLSEPVASAEPVTDAVPVEPSSAEAK